MDEDFEGPLDDGLIPGGSGAAEELYGDTDNDVTAEAPFNVTLGFYPGDGVPMMEIQGGEITPETMEHAYATGYFPWYSFRMEPAPRWVCPLRRFVLFPDEVHISHSMRTLINRGELRVTFNKAFRDVIEGCRAPRYDELYAWLSRRMSEVCCELNRRGEAMSVEVWDMSDNLVGGLYGILSGGVFCGESMFSRVASASKLAFIRLAQMLSGSDRTLIDCQMYTAHHESMGARYIEISEYLNYLRDSDIVETGPRFYNKLMASQLTEDCFVRLKEDLFTGLNGQIHYDV